MKKITTVFLSVLVAILSTTNFVLAQRGYFDAPYIRYEADLASMTNATVTARSYAQSDLQSEATGQVCVNLSEPGASVSWTLSAEGDGLVIRYSIPDGETGSVEVYADNILIDTLDLTSYYSWQNLGLSNKNPKMRFDEVRMKLPSKIAAGGNLKLVRLSGQIHLDFAELEPVASAISAEPGNLTYTGDGSTLQNFIDANGGRTIYLPPGVYNVNRELYFGVNNTVLKGGGIWYTEIHFDNTAGGKGGLRANASNISFSDLYLTTINNSRDDSYKAINGVYTAASTIRNIWTEHFECGAWIGQYNTGGPAYADGFTMSDCRFRNNYADGINLCKGTRNAVVEHCSFRNNGDDDMAIWSANGLECRNNTYRYNTSENCWRAAGCAIYGGLNNKAHHLLIKDNLEVGIRVNNDFPGAGFNKNGMHVFSDITIIGCGTFNDLFNNPVGAIDIACNNSAGTRINNVRFSKIDIIDSKNDAIYIYKKAGEGFFNLVLDSISIDGTGKEFPFNDSRNLKWDRGFGILFSGLPKGNIRYCNLNFTNLAGKAPLEVNKSNAGTLDWKLDCTPPTPTIITSLPTFGICNSPVTFSAVTTPPAGTTVSYMQFFVDSASIGKDDLSPFSIDWKNPSGGNHQLSAVAHYSDSTTSASLTQYFGVEDGIFVTATAPVIDGAMEELWGNHKPFSLDKIPVPAINGAADLSADFRITRDAANLYILLDVTDDILRTNSRDNYMKDGVELYIDMGNDKNGGYTPNNDFNYNFIYGVSTPKAGLTYAQTTKPGNLGYVLEIKIPWTTLKSVPAPGTFMGFDIHINDNDNDLGQRDGKKSWYDETDNAWQSISVLGTLQIGDCPNPFVPTGIDDRKNEGGNFDFFPNPFSGTANLDLTSGNGMYDVNITDMNGRLVISKNLKGGSVYAVGEQIAPGIYLMQISDGLLKQSVKLVKF